jgi:hypothetical protein
MSDVLPDPRELELYKLTVEMADRVSARRGAANTLFLSLQSSTIAVLGFLTAGGRGADRWVLVGICAAGFLMAATWWLQLRSYRDLNRAKFAVINSLEERLPVAPFANEWALLKKDPLPWWRPRYAELGTAERVVPIVFAGVNVALGVYLWTR